MTENMGQALFLCSLQIITLLIQISLCVAQFEYLQCPLSPNYPNPQHSWTSWSLVANDIMGSEPSAIAISETELQVFALGPQNETLYWKYSNNRWDVFEILRPPLFDRITYVTSAPVPGMTSKPETLTLFGKGPQDSLVSANCPGLSGCDQLWTDLGGVILHAPAVTSFTTNRLDVFVINTGTSVSWKTITGGVDGEWKALTTQGRLVTKVAAVSRNFGSIDLVGIGTNNRLYHRSYTHSNGQWTNWVKVDDRILSSAPAAITGHPWRIDVFVRGVDNDCLQITWRDGVWSGYSSLGGVLSAAPSATVRNGNRIDVFARGSNGKLYQKSYI